MRILETYNFENQTTYGVTGEIKTATLLGSKKIAIANESNVEIFDFDERQHDYFPNDFKQASSSSLQEQEQSTSSISINCENIYLNVGESIDSINSEEIQNCSNNLIKNVSSNQNQSNKKIFATLGDIQEMIYCKEGSYLLTLEKFTNFDSDCCGESNQQNIGERKHSNKDNKSFKVLIYTNILEYFQNNCSKKRPRKEMPLIVPRIASKITPTARISEGIEMIELEVYEPPDMINCCQETGNILVKSNFHLYIFSYKKCLNEQQHFNYIDFFEFPFYLELNFLPKQIALIENVIACINQKQCIVFKILTHEQQRRSTTSGRENVIYSNNNDSIMDCDDIDEDDGNVYSYGTSTTTTTTTTATTTESATTLSYNSNCDDVFYGAGVNNKYGENGDLKNCDDQLNFNMENVKLNKNDNEYDEKCVYRGKKDIDTDSLECVNRNENVKIENFLKTKINLKNNSLNYETLIKNSELNDCKLCSNTDPIQNVTNNNTNCTENTVNCQLLNEDLKNVTIEDHPIQSTELNVKLINEKHYNFSYGENNQPCINSCQKNQDKKYEIKKMLQIRMASLKHSNLVKIPETFTCFDLKAIYKKPASECGTQANTSTISNNNTDLVKSKRYKNCIGFSFIITTTAADGYLYQFCNNGKWYRENQKPLTKYQFTAQVISIIISDFVVHAITRETIETVTSRIGHKLFSSYYEYPMLSDPFPNESAATTDMQIFCMKLHSFCNIQFVLKTNESLILISKCPIECCINSNISGNTSSCNNSNDALVVNPKLSLSVKNSGNKYSNTISNQSNTIVNSANDREQTFHSNQYDTIRNCSTFEITSNNVNSISDKKDNQKPINPSGSNNGGGGSGSGVVNLLNGKYFQFNSINKNKNSSKRSNKIINKLIRQNSLEWTVYNLKMPDAVRLTEDLESSARETLKNGKSIFTKGKNEGNFSPTTAAITELINSTVNTEENEIDNSKNPNSSNNTNSSLSTTTATYDLVYELLTEANIILRLAKNLDFNYNDSYISEVDKMFKRNCKFLADTIIQLDKEDQYSEAIGYYRMSETSLQTIYTTYFNNLKLQPNTGLNCINDSNKMIGLTHTMKTYLNCFAKTRADSDFLFEVITPILAQKKHQANNEESTKICSNKLATPGSLATTRAKTNNYTYDENNTIQFGYELFRYFCIHDKNLLGTLGLKSMPFLDCNINNYLTYLSLSASKSNYNEMLLYSLALSRIKSFEAALVQLEKMSRYQLFLSLKFAWQILFDDNFNPEDCKDETFSEFTERVLFRTKKTELIEAISDVFLFYLCITNRIEIKFIIELFVNYFALHVENCNNNIKNDKTTSNTNSKESSSTTSSNKNFNINYNNDIPRKIFEIILGGYCQDILSPEISTNENHILPSPINNINNNYLNKSKKNKLYCSKSDTVEDKSNIDNSEIENRIININHECQIECNNSIVIDIMNKTDASTSKTIFEETTNFNLNYGNNFIFMTDEQSPAVKAIIILLRLYLGNLALATKEKHKITINSNDLKSNENLNSVDNVIDLIDQEILMITRIQYINELINLFEKNKLPRIKWLKRSNLNDNITNSKNINDNITNNNNNNDKNNNRNNNNNNICSNNKTINGNYNNENKNKMINNNNNINDNNNNNKTNNINNHCVNKSNISMNYIELLPEILPNYDVIQQTNDNNRLKIEFIEAVNNYIRPIVCLNERPSYLNVMKPFKKDHFKNNYFIGHSDEIVMWVLKTQGLLNSVKTNCILYDFLLFIQKNPDLIGIDSFISILLPIDMSIQFLIIVYPEALYEFGKCYKITNDDFRSIFRALIAKIRELNCIKSTADKSFEYYQQQIKRYQKILDGILQSLHNDRSFESFLNCLPTEEVSISGRFIIREDTSSKNNNGNKEANTDRSYNENNCQNITTNISAKQYIMDNVDETNLFQIFLRKCVAKQRVEALQAMIESTGKQLFEAAKNSQLNLN